MKKPEPIHYETDAEYFRELEEYNRHISYEKSFKTWCVFGCAITILVGGTILLTAYLLS